MSDHHPQCPFDPDATDPSGKCQCALIELVCTSHGEQIASRIRARRDNSLHAGAIQWNGAIGVASEIASGRRT